MITVWVCDDNERMALLTAKFIEREFIKRNETFKLEVFNNGKDVMEVFENDRKAPDLLFIAIKMKGMDGISVSDSFKKAYCNTLILFMSVYESALKQAAGKNPFACINKNLLNTEIPYFLDKALLKLNHRSTSELMVRSKGINLSLPVDEILFLMSYNKRIIISTQKGERFIVRDTIKRLSLILPEETFYIINRGVIINIIYVEKLNGKDLVLSCGEIFGCSREGKRVMKEKLNGRTMV